MCSTTHITVVDTNRHSRNMLHEMIDENHQASVVDVVESVDEIQDTVCDQITDARPIAQDHIDAVVFEPHFSTSTLPWHNLRVVHTTVECARRWPGVRCT